MKNLLGILIYSLLLTLSSSLLAKEHIVETKSGKMIFTTDESEISQRKFFGADLWFTGEVRGKKRTVMSILYNSAGAKLELGNDKKHFNKFKDKMRAFGKKRGYSKIKFEPFSFNKINEKVAYHNFIWSYEKGGIGFKEESYYVECGPIFFIAKATTFDDSVADQEKFKKILESVKCVK